MLEGCVPWPDAMARRYRELGYWEDITIAEMLSRTVRRHPDKTRTGMRRATHRLPDARANGAATRVPSC